MQIINGKKAATIPEIAEATRHKFEVIEILYCLRKLFTEMEEGKHYFHAAPDSVEVLLTRKGVELITEKGVYEAYAVDLSSAYPMFDEK